MPTIAGVVGRVTWAYRLAATLDGYRVTYRKGPPAVWALEGTLAVFDRFVLNQRPLMFEAPYAKGVWKWPIDRLELVDGRLVARLGAPLKG